MLSTLEEIGIEAAMILAVVVATSCFIYLVALTVLERRVLRRMRMAALDQGSSIVDAETPSRPVLTVHSGRSAGQHV